MTKKEIFSSEDWKQRKFALVLGRLTEKNDPKDLEDVEIIPLSAEKFLKLFPEDQMSLFDYYGQSSYPEEWMPSWNAFFDLLIRHPDHRVRTELAKTKFLTYAHVKTLSEDVSHDVRDALVHNDFALPLLSADDCLRLVANDVRLTDDLITNLRFYVWQALVSQLEGNHCLALEERLSVLLDVASRLADNKEMGIIADVYRIHKLHRKLRSKTFTSEDNEMLQLAKQSLNTPCESIHKVDTKNFTNPNQFTLSIAVIKPATNRKAKLEPTTPTIGASILIPVCDWFDIPIKLKENKLSQKIEIQSKQK